MKKLLAAVLLVFGLLTACASCGTQSFGSSIPTQVTTSDVIDNALYSGVVIYDYGPDLICAGQRVSPTELLTAFHCVLGANYTDADLERMGISDSPNTWVARLKPDMFVGDTITYSTYDAQLKAGRYGKVKGEFATVARVDIAHDLAILKTDPSSQTYVELRDEPIAVGLPVFSIGHPVGLEFSYARGYVSNPCRWLKGSPDCYAQIDISLYGGSSGGGLYDLNGKLVGIAARKILDTYGFFTSYGATVKIVRGV